MFALLSNGFEQVRRISPCSRCGCERAAYDWPFVSVFALSNYFPVFRVYSIDP